MTCDFGSVRTAGSRAICVVQNTQIACVAMQSLMFVPALDVDWAAHLGGLISGFTASFLCFAPKIKTKYYAIIWFFFSQTVFSCDNLNTTIIK